MDILVHISAPSRGADDARYRKEAQGFLDFEPPKSHPVTSSRSYDHASKSVGNSSTQGDDEIQHSDSLRATQRVEAIRRLFLQNVASTTPVRVDAVERQLQAPALPWTSVKETPHLLIERTPAIQRPQTAPNAATPSATKKLFRRTQSDSWRTPPSVVLNSQPTQGGIEDQTANSPIQKRSFQSSSPSPNKNSSPSSKRARRQSSPRPMTVAADSRSDRPSSHALEPLSSFSSQPNTSVPNSRARLPLEIHPPKPPIGNAKFKSHLTKSLHRLSTLPALQECKVDKSASRTIDKLERGHWFVPLRSWEQKTKDKYWKFLTAFVGGGKAGWGVWCIRELMDKSKPDSSDKENQSPGQEEVTKVYCWGEVVGDVYLMLFVAAGKSLRTGGAKWIDAAGNVVVDLT